jgi:outer membrane scaffolding protein for murein synthesis (MipA/OmpV family)
MKFLSFACTGARARAGALLIALLAAASVARAQPSVEPAPPANAAPADLPAAAAQPADPAASAAAAPSPAAEPVTRYVLGAALAYAPDYSGSQRSSLKPRPLWAWQHGRYRLSTGGAGAVLGFGVVAPDAGPGASADIAAKDKWRLGAVLRIDNGRSSSDSPDLAGLPDVRRTLRGRLFTTYTFDAHWSVGANVSEDLLGRGGGATAGLGLGYHLPLGKATEWNIGGGANFGDRRYLSARYALPADVAAARGVAAYEPGGGIESINIGTGIMTALSPNWIVYANLGASSLRGGAAASPLTTSATTWQASIGFGWRNRP